MNKFRANLHPAFFRKSVDVPAEQTEESQAIEWFKKETKKLETTIRRNNESLASSVEQVDKEETTDKELAKQLKQLAKNKKIDFPWTDNAWRCSRAEKKLATSSAKVFQQLLDVQTLTQMINKCKSKSWELNEEEAEAWKTELRINSKPKDIQNFYKAFKEYQNPQSEYQHLKNLMWFFCESDFSNIEDVSHALENRSQKISKSDIEKWEKVLYQENEGIIIDNKTGEKIDRKPKDWRKRSSFEIIKDRLKNKSWTDRMLTLLWDFNLDGEVNSGDVGYKTWTQVVDVFRRTVASKALEDKTFTSDKAVENLAKYANKFGVNMENIQTVDGLYAWMTDNKKWYENTITLQNFLKNLSIELWDVLENWENAWQQSLDRMVSAIWLEKKEEEAAKKVAEEKAKEIVSAWEARLKEVIKDDRERASITQQLLTQLPAMLVDKAMWEKNNWLGIGYGMPLDQIIKWMSAGFNVWIGTDWKPKFWLFVWWDRKFDLSKTTDLRTAVSAGTKLLFVPCVATSIELGQDVNKWSRDHSLDAKGEHRITLWWNVTAVPWIFSYGFSAGYENDKQRGIEKQVQNINKVIKNQAKGRIESLKGAKNKEEALKEALRTEFPKTSDGELNAATRNLLSIIQQFKIDEKTTKEDLDIYAQIVADVYSEQWRNAKLSWIADNKRKISWWKVGIQFIAWCVPVAAFVAKFTKYRNARTNETEHSRVARIDAQVNGTGNRAVTLEWTEIWENEITQFNEILARYGAKSKLVPVKGEKGRPGKIQVPVSIADGVWINVRVSENLKWCVNYIKNESTGEIVSYSFPANAEYRILQETWGNQRSVTLNIGSNKNSESDVMLSDTEKMEGLIWDKELVKGKKWQYKENFENKGSIEYKSDIDSLFTADVIEWLKTVDSSNRRRFSEFMRTKRDAINNFDEMLTALRSVLWKNKKYEAIMSKLDDENVAFEDKQLIIDRIMAYSAYTNVHDKKWLDQNVKRRGNYYRKESMKGPNWQSIFDKLSVKRDDILSEIHDYNPVFKGNILWATAFYHRNNTAKWLALTWLGATNVLWGTVKPLENDDRVKAEKWFMWWENEKWDYVPWVLEKTPTEWANLKRIVKGKMGLSGDLSDENLKKILKWEEVELTLDNSKKMVKVKLEQPIKYVFYLMWECANESVGMELWNITILEQEEVDDYAQGTLDVNNGDRDNRVGVDRKTRAIGIAFGGKKKEEKKEEKEPEDNPWSKPSDGQDKTTPEQEWTPIEENDDYVPEENDDISDKWEHEDWPRWNDEDGL